MLMKKLGAANGRDVLHMQALGEAAKQKPHGFMYILAGNQALRPVLLLLQHYQVMLCTRLRQECPRSQHCQVLNHLCREEGNRREQAQPQWRLLGRWKTREVGGEEEEEEEEEEEGEKDPVLLT
ncbi:hypothetical protein EYF80_040756 [Liparis tanakae]|uniref:Uncharacterized protein n=1 Tax=Liparis tanakae TaxID=230148 RepID=A0A4Z2G653_9TELE|nr:hypothetical protein EYF80_040756 [Liparis tanakae]